ncbi:MAG TPA: bifunctional phosphoribosylaminoimidazolecarboxamide formyltransferase/IMP cyclohydrolase [Candidatus Polarisedimenticolia bacterium]|nr:bifunctional phosphoribosylaminoimidazolecarboxamide formyltransferase/IMP cyclohydrolase [Candidatus Polarisedimenticolia bacterium]
MPRRALVSVYDKTGVVALARRLAGLGFQILSTGGTAEALRRDGLEVTDVSRHTGQPEILGGRVKTLHPRIHGGLLGDPSEPSHRADMERSQIEPIGLAVVNLYPFRSVAAKPDASLGELIEMIDIGGPAMIRSAAKNHAAVGVLVDPADYGPAADEIEKTGGLSEETRRRLAAKAFAHTAAYDADIRDTLARRFAAQEGTPDRGGAPEFPQTIHLEFHRRQSLRYGENPHQKGALYVSPARAPGTVAQARQLQGKELSYNNLLDLDAAWRLVREFDRPAAVIVKHNNPCGVACAATLAEAFEEARRTDPVSAFGGIVAFNRELDAGAAGAATGIFLECLIAPSIAAAARDALQAKTALRVLEAGTPDPSATAPFDVRSVSGGLLVQDFDTGDADVAGARVVTRRAPTAEERRALVFAWKVAKHVKSNAIVIARGERTLGVGAGQMSRVDSVRLAVGKSQEPVSGGVLASDAFFPFRDGLDEAAKAGVTAVVQPGGSIRDEEIVAAADEHGLAMVVTGLRHFRH